MQPCGVYFHAKCTLNIEHFFAFLPYFVLMAAVAKLL